MSNIDNLLYTILVAIKVPKEALVFKFGGNMIPDVELEIQKVKK